ncbi:hypothetical protein SSX86_032905 [Deinandra increscens subsp. villosa]|uniref:Alpha/beta hydrolase fold-3 domain-containing protein n=1 Tax=Deinandra increscens subsp. villosa TaxID=3103831 RepID=A0AAP0GGV0_9ASTR
MSDHTLPSNQNPPLMIVTKYLTINHVTKTGVRIHIPKKTLTSTGQKKLPLIVYFYGSGFVTSKTASTHAHMFCDQLAAHLPCVVVNVDYRLAPEHRLPVAYDDGVEALHWVKSTHDPWLTNFVDFSNCHLMGTSAGANLAYHAGLRVSKQVIDLEPLKINGLILSSPFFGGMGRMESEGRLGAGAWSGNFTLSVSDAMWDFALPVDASRDHEYCNPMMGDMGPIKDVGWRVMVTGRYSDFLIDREMEFAKTLEAKGVECRWRLVHGM